MASRGGGGAGPGGIGGSVDGRGGEGGATRGARFTMLETSNMRGLGIHP